MNSMLICITSGLSEHLSNQSQVLVHDHTIAMALHVRRCAAPGRGSVRSCSSASVNKTAGLFRDIPAGLPQLFRWVNASPLRM